MTASFRVLDVFESFGGGGDDGGGDGDGDGLIDDERVCVCCEFDYDKNVYGVVFYAYVVGICRINY